MLYSSLSLSFLFYTLYIYTIYIHYIYFTLHYTTVKITIFPVRKFDLKGSSSAYALDYGTRSPGSSICFAFYAR